MKNDSATPKSGGAGSLFPLYCLIWGSGFSALVYQTVWFREFRLIFGCSTIATAAVMAIFMGGLGFGGLFFGKRADQSHFPLRLYAKLELGIAILAALSPWLIDATRWGYIQLCIAVSPALPAKTIFRLLLALMVLGPPTFLMGGTLPAVAKAAIKEMDISRISFAVLYGCNTIGAVFGAFLGTFFLFEFWGYRKTLWLAAFLSLLVAWLAFLFSPNFPSGKTSEEGELPPSAPPKLVYLSAFLCGFCFFIMEIVWFRILAPLMGGTTYSFGLILGIALLGLGIGGLIFQFRSASKPAGTLDFTISVVLQGVLVAFSFALGDSVAILAWVMNHLGILGFSGRVFSWTITGLIIVFPSSVVSGYQFPLLISLLGRGEKELGQQVGRAYACNSLGSIMGVLLGGFVLLPTLTAQGCWRLVVVTLLTIGMGWIIWFWKTEPRKTAFGFPIFLGLIGVFLLSFPGPTAFFRYGNIGYENKFMPQNWNQILRTINADRHWIKEEFEGVESGLGINFFDGISFMTNGQTDGNSIRDAFTQLMLGLVPAIFHQYPRKAFVVGLGTGSTSGALGMVPSMEKVLTAETEPDILEVARKCRDVNFAALENPKLLNIFDDAREVLLTSSESFDLIVSEPSNPHRAGISSLFTQEFYQTVKNRLAPGGIFAQWVQFYRVDSKTYSSIFATLFSVFPYIETWECPFSGDTLLLCSSRPITWDLDLIKLRIEKEPFRSALASAWKSYDFESFIAPFVCSTEGGRLIARGAQKMGAINSDDWLPLEYSFARSLEKISDRIIDIRHTTRMFGFESPPVPKEKINWTKVEESRILSHDFNQPITQDTDKNTAHLIMAWRAWKNQSFQEVRNHLSSRKEKPSHPIEVLMYCEAFAQVADVGIIPMLSTFPPDREIEKLIIVAEFLFSQGNFSRSRDALVEAFYLHRKNPWPLSEFIDRALVLSDSLAQKDRTLAKSLFECLEKPFCQFAAEEKRLKTLLFLARYLSNEVLFAQFQRLDPNPFWEDDFLRLRNQCYQQVSPQFGKISSDDLKKFQASIVPTLSDFLRTPSEAGTR